MDPLKLFIPIRKVDVKNQIVFGVAAQEVPDRADEIMDYATAKPNFAKWSAEMDKATDGKSKGNLRAMHGKVAAGRVDKIEFDDAEKSILVSAKVVDKAEWEKVLEGVYSGFSMGGSYAKRWQDPDNADLMRYTPVPQEISLVDRPCIPTATFDVLKADGAVEKRAFKAVALPSNAEIAARATELAKAAGVEAKWGEFLEKARADLLAVGKASTIVDEEPAKKPMPSNDEIAARARKLADESGNAGNWPDFIERARAELAAPEPPLIGAEDNAATMTAVGAKAAGSEPPGASGDPWEQVWLCKADGKTFKTKAELRAHLTQIEASAAAKKATGGVLDKLDAIDAKLGIGKAADGTAADIEAVDAALVEAIESKNFAGLDEIFAAAPAAYFDELRIATADKAATKYGLEKRQFSAKEREAAAKSGEAMPDGSFPIKTKADLANAVKAYGRAKDKDAAKAHIIKRAKALGATDALPDDWKKSDKSAAAIEALAKAASANMDKAAAHSTMTHFHAAMAKAAGDSGDAKDVEAADAHKSASGAHASAYLAHSLGSADKSARSDAAWEATAKCAKCVKLAEAPARDVVAKMATIHRAGSLAKWAGEEVWDAKAAVDALTTIFSLWRSEMFEAEKSPEQLAALETAIGKIKEFIASEIMEDNKSDDEAMIILELADRLGNLSKLAKAGKRNSEKDQKSIQKAHDALIEVGAICDSGNAVADQGKETSKLAAVSDELSKIAAERDELKKVIEDRIMPRLEEISKRVQKIEDEPLPLPLSGAARTVSKGEDSTRGDDLTDTAALDKLLSTADGRDAVSLLLLKAAQRNPIRPGA